MTDEQGGEGETIAIKDPFLVAYPGEEGGQRVILDPAFFGQPEHVGIFLVDLARHFARAMASAGKAESEQDALARMRVFLDAEWDHPTDPGSGGLLG